MSLFNSELPQQVCDIANAQTMGKCMLCALHAALSLHAAHTFFTLYTQRVYVLSYYETISLPSVDYPHRARWPMTLYMILAVFFITQVYGFTY